MIRHFLSVQFLLFLFVGVTAAVLNWLARYVLDIWLSFPLAVALAYFVSIAAAFVLNRKYVFPTSTRPVQKQARDFVMVNALFFPVVWVASIWIRQFLIENEIVRNADGIAHGLAISIPAFVTFLIYKFIAFGSK